MNALPVASRASRASVSPSTQRPERGPARAPEPRHDSARLRRNCRNASGSTRYPPSGVRSPRSPSGRKTRIRIRIEKTIDCVQSLPGACHARRVVEGLDEPDEQRAQDGARQVADTAEHGGREWE